MNHNDKIVLVSGATGQQGGATARHLLANGWPVRALTRNPNSPAALVLAEGGAEVVQGDLDDRTSLEKAMEGAYGVFSFPNMAQGVEVEDRQGKMMAADDIGAFAALAFENPQDYIGQAIEIAGDELTEPQIVDTIAKVIGQPVKLVRPEGPSRYEEGDVMIAWFNKKGYEADIPGLREAYPSLTTLETWLRQAGWGTT